MAPKLLHMIGHSHIDPVWFWKWEEGMQEVRATFRSALDRMNEFPDFHFTCTSAAYFAYIRRINPEMFEEIRQRVQEGRWEIVGGWWLEPDCNLPSGESFVRHGLYGQRFLRENLGVTASVGANFDSFGHNPQLPQILKKSGLNGYVFQRPMVTQSKREIIPGRECVFSWVAPDGTAIPAVSLPGEYTAWFHHTVKKNIDDTLAAPGGHESLPCCYGVGNHGGGPTIANIRSVEQLRAEYPDAELRFSRLDAFFSDLAASGKELPECTAYLDHINTGCYSVDIRLKQAVRKAEETLLRAEALSAMAHMAGAPWAREDTAPLWKRLLFNQFHDTLGGTMTEEAHADALRDVNGVIHEGEILCNLAMQAVIRHIAIPEKGVPIVLFNPTMQPWQGMADVEAAWFCKSDLRLTDMDGREIPYVRTKQSCTMVWRVLGGRRRIIFPAQIPAMGVTVCYATEEESTSRVEIRHEGDPYCISNGLVSLRLNEQGDPVSLVDLSAGFESLQGPCAFTIWSDDRDPWGHLAQNFGPEEHAWVIDSVECVEASDIRQVLRVRKHTDGLTLELHYVLNAGEPTVRMDCRLIWNQPWHQLRLQIPGGGAAHLCESPYGVMHHGAADEELFMHRFLDIHRENGAGLAVTNDSLYGFQPRDGVTDLLILRSPIYAQGADRSLWMHDYDTYHYMDIGDQAFSLTLTPHGAALPPHELFRLADRHAQGTQYLVGGMVGNRGTAEIPAMAFSEPAVRLGALKKAEDGDAFILRLQETDGSPCTGELMLMGRVYPLSFSPYEIKTLRFDGEMLTPVNMLEDPE